MSLRVGTDVSVYVETTVVSYLTARPSRDLIAAARQEATREWWEAAQDAYALVASELVIEEAAAGDKAAAEARLAWLRGLPLLEITAPAATLAQGLLDADALPAEAPRDALHIAVAAIHSVPYLATWNFRHIANVTKRVAIARAIEDAGYDPPVIATPEDLLEVLRP